MASPITSPTNLSSFPSIQLLCEKQQKNDLVDWSRLDSTYNKAKENLQKILPFEAKLAELDAKSHQNRAAIYAEYIQSAREFLNDEMVQVLYERMVTDCCLNGKLLCGNRRTQLERRPVFSDLLAELRQIH